MKRRDFLKYLGFVAMGLTVLPVLPKPKKIASIEIPVKDFDFLEFRKWHIGEIVRILNIPESKLMGNYSAKLRTVKKDGYYVTR